MKIVFDLEPKEQDAAFFALYAGLRMYKEKIERRVLSKDSFSIAAAQAHCLLQDLKEQHPDKYKEAELSMIEFILRLLIINETKLCGRSNLRKL